MREKFRIVNFRGKSRDLLSAVVEITNKYQEQKIKLTLRQLYYQLVVEVIISNRQSEYNKLGRLIRDARYAGLLDWDAIEDRVRVPQVPNEFNGIPDLLEAAVDSYRLDRWKGQRYYVEMFTEKDALSSILAPIAHKWHIAFNVNRGYASTTAAFESAQRVKAAMDSGKEPVLLYLGDHDPSGLDMIRDLRDRMKEFCNGRDITVEHIAITWEQIQQYEPPPNPAKFTDTRAREYVKRHGRHSWEVDALPPEVLHQTVNQAVESLVDKNLMDSVIKQEKADKHQLQDIVEWFNEENEALIH